MRRKVLAVRLDSTEKRLLDETSERLGVSQSEVVREAIVRYAAEAKHRAKATAEELLAPWVGKYSGMDPELSTRTGSRFRKLMEKKHGRRPR